MRQYGAGFKEDRFEGERGNRLPTLAGFAVGLDYQPTDPKVDALSKLIFENAANMTPDVLKKKHLGLHNPRTMRRDDAILGRTARSNQRELFYFLDRMRKLADEMEMPDEADSGSDSDQEGRSRPTRLTKRSFEAIAMARLLAKQATCSHSC